jgi:1-acyl-sn-glycerol-3-phosphate acyltransferase
MPAMPPPLVDDPASNDPVPHDLAHATANETTAPNHGPEPSPPPQRGIVEFIWGAVATASAVFYTAALAPCAALVSMLGYPHLATPISRLWGWLIVRTSGVTAEIEGLEHLAGLKSYVLVSNHQSFFDIFAICAWMPGEPRFVAKQELGKIPVLGSAMRRSGHIMIDRAKGGQAIRKALKIAREGFSIVVFAEGTRFSDNRVHPFNDGAAWLAIATRQKCVPMAISGTAGFFPRGARIVRPGRRMRMAIGPPVDTTEMRGADREALTHQLEASVRALFRTEV